MFGREKEKWWEEMESIRVGGRGLFRGFVMAGWAYRLTQQLFLFLCLFCFCLHTQNFGAAFG